VRVCVREGERGGTGGGGGAWEGRVCVCLSLTHDRHCQQGHKAEHPCQPFGDGRARGWAPVCGAWVCWKGVVDVGKVHLCFEWVGRGKMDGEKQTAHSSVGPRACHPLRESPSSLTRTHTHTMAADPPSPLLGPAAGRAAAALLVAALGTALYASTLPARLVAAWVAAEAAYFLLFRAR